MADLNEQQKRFCLEYLKDMNGTQAAKRAGYKAPSAQGSRLLQNAAVRQYLKIEFTKHNSNIKQSVKRIVQELERVAFSDITNYIEISGGGIEIKDSKKWAKGSSRAVSEVSESVTAASINKKFKLHDKLRGLELLGKYYKMFNEQLELTGKDGGPIETKNLPLSPEEKAELDLYRVKLGSKKK